MTKIIGLTGGIGSGKTTIAKMFAEYGIPIYIADDEAKQLMQSEELVSAIFKKFGSSIFDDGKLNRAKLAAIVFNDAEKLKLLNEIVHPAVKKHFEKWLLGHNDQLYVIYEAAILFESGRYRDCDYIITVNAPVDVRIQRVMQRDNSSKEEVLNRINMQWNDLQRSEKSNFVINNIDIVAVKQEIVKILKILDIKQNDS
ncbi:dephospho-CoA kinase [Flavobacterium sp. TAB 87]|uniref:dephospho-CoA kinase n=1 Tax=Flavobacterium sp. TAB 87 TaxID=1729581 RepID=UPI00076DE502|nr:dephospho-CoA kinase [Flavobacterium sp. TAB 87]KVV15828.1 Dephospho-CoA kinase [Flavobacterium sp. TAB 87]